ncbi:MAG: hypothetical protein U5P41_16105 [Gammaproteobacteria bacterium]|nr:hypothetical protein [Gammaproteobacteria bacterium]
MTEAITQLQAVLSEFRIGAEACYTVDDTAALHQALDKLADAAGHADYLGLQDCAVLLQQHIDDIVATGRISEGQIKLLKSWPQQVNSYLETQGDAESSQQLLDNLGNADWPAPLTPVDAEVLHEMLIRKATTASTDLQPELERLAVTIRAIDDQKPETLHQAVTELGQLAHRLGEAGETALQDCTILLQQNIEDIAASGEPMSDTRKTLLTAWSGLAGNCLNRPDDELSRRALIENLCHPHWPAALAIADAAVLYELFGIEPPQQPADDTGTAAPTTTTADNVMPFPARPEADDLPALARLDTSLSQVEIDNPTTVTNLTAPLAELADTVGSMEQIGLQDICLLLQQQLEDLVAADTGLNNSQINRIKQWLDDVRNYLANPSDSNAAEAILACLSDHCWPNPLDAADLEIIREMLTGETGPAVVPETSPEQNVEPAAAEDSSSEAVTMTDLPPTDTAAEPDISDEPVIAEPVSQPISLELVDMLASESMQMHEDAKQLCEQLYTADLTPALRSDSLSQYATRLERFGNASQAAELIGLQQACELFYKNICDLNHRGGELSEHQISACWCDWPNCVGNYLGSIGDNAASQALVHILLDSDWITPLAAELEQPLIDLLTAAYISDHVAQSERMQTATARRHQPGIAGGHQPGTAGRFAAGAARPD